MQARHAHGRGQLAVQVRLPMVLDVVAQARDDDDRGGRAHAASFMASRRARITFLSSLPTLVLGSASTNCTWSGTAKREMVPSATNLAMCSRTASALSCS